MSKSRSTGPASSQLAAGIAKAANLASALQRSHNTDSRPREGFDAPSRPTPRQTSTAADLANVLNGGPNRGIDR